VRAHGIRKRASNILGHGGSSAHGLERKLPVLIIWNRSIACWKMPPAYALSPLPRDSPLTTTGRGYYTKAATPLIDNPISRGNTIFQANQAYLKE
jgi:hypothetical protein